MAPSLASERRPPGCPHVWTPGHLVYPFRPALHARACWLVMAIHISSEGLPISTIHRSFNSISAVIPPGRRSLLLASSRDTLAYVCYPSISAFRNPPGTNSSWRTASSEILFSNVGLVLAFSCSRRRRRRKHRVSESWVFLSLVPVSPVPHEELTGLSTYVPCFAPTSGCWAGFCVRGTRPVGLPACGRHIYGLMTLFACSYK